MMKDKLLSIWTEQLAARVNLSLSDRLRHTWYELLIFQMSACTNRESRRSPERILPLTKIALSRISIRRNKLLREETLLNKTTGDC